MRDTSNDHFARLGVRSTICGPLAHIDWRTSSWCQYRLSHPHVLAYPGGRGSQQFRRPGTVDYISRNGAAAYADDASSDW
jgi:hypothetical protein